MSKLFNAIKELENKTKKEVDIKFYKKDNNRISKEKHLQILYLLGIISLLFIILTISKYFVNHYKDNKKIISHDITENQTIKKEEHLLQLKQNKKKLSDLSDKDKPNIENKKRTSEKNSTKLITIKEKREKLAYSKKLRNKTKKKKVNTKERQNKNINQSLLMAEEYRKKEMYEQALIEYKKALAEEKDEKNIIYILNNVGAIYILKEKPAQALKYLLKAYKIKKDKITARNIVLAYIQLGKFKKACQFASQENLEDIKEKLGCY